jgi:hypothetical protein
VAVARANPTRSRKRINNAKAEAKQVRNSKANPVKARVNPARSRKRINNAKAEAKRGRNSKTNPAKGSVPAIRKIRKQRRAVASNPTVARTATATPVAAAAVPTASGTWTTLISTAR